VHTRHYITIRIERTPKSRSYDTEVDLLAQSSFTMNNLLGNIPAWAADDSDDEQVGDIEKAKGKPTFMDHYFREVDKIKGDIDAVSKATKQIGVINDQAMIATTTVEEKKLSKKLKPLVDATNARARVTKTLLGLLKEETEKLEKEEKINGSDLR
jgi:hypothetical protein